MLPRFRRGVIVPAILRAGLPHANGKWHVTHGIEVPRPVPMTDPGVILCRRL